ncbi:P-loop containing nucleoside triphosphate hydrolase protein [Paraphysoderma sedebokerense]|nr:P-loop containing nucleoside triphosphate hydrolase protein [Paraphysoderma sedebokerense]
MPHLSTLTHILNPFDDPLIDSHINNLILLGYSTDKQFLLHFNISSLPPSHKSLFDPKIIDNISQALVTTLAVRPIDGSALLKKVTSRQKILSTGCDGLDIILSGGFRTGEVIEISGPPAVGKTQLCFFLAAKTILSSKDSTVLYFDSNNSFSSNRISGFLQTSDALERDREKWGEDLNTESFLSRVKVVKSYEIFNLLHHLDNLKHNLQSLVRRSSDPFVSNLDVIIIDSIASIISPALKVAAQNGFALMTQLCQVLITIARDCNVAVLITNHVVQSHPYPYPQPNTPSLPCSQHLKPALGLTFSHFASKSLFLSFARDKKSTNDDGEGDVGWYRKHSGCSKEHVEIKRRIIEIVKCRSGVC